MQKGIRRRQHVRVTLPGGLWGSLGAGSEVRVLNLSPGGAMIEHTERLALGEHGVLFLRLGMLAFRLPGRVVWSQLCRGEVHPPDRITLAFRSGLRFAQLPWETELDLRQFLATVTRPPA